MTLRNGDVQLYDPATWRPGVSLRGHTGAVRSLTLAPDSLPGALEVTAETADGVIMGVMHRSHPVHGVQFHPESIASENGHALLQNFLNLAEAFARAPA